MEFREGFDEAGGPADALEGGKGSGSPGGEVSIPFPAEWGSFGVVPGDGGDRSGEEDREVVIVNGAEVPSRGW